LYERKNKATWKAKYPVVMFKTFDTKYLEQQTFTCANGIRIHISERNIQCGTSYDTVVQLTNFLMSKHLLSIQASKIKRVATSERHGKCGII
jgi:hypothetical protein